jgi:hypothetical protein
VEVLISLAISASLLTAVGAAFSATAAGIEENDQFTRATNGARAIVNHLTAEVRRGEVDPLSTSTVLRLVTYPPGGLPGEQRTYRYIPPTAEVPGRIMVVTNVGTPEEAQFVLARNVADAKFTCTPGTNAKGDLCTAQVAVSVTVRVGRNTVRITGSAAPRASLLPQ